MAKSRAKRQPHHDRLNNISEIIEVDVSPIEVTTFGFSGQTLEATKPVNIRVSFNPEDGIYVAEGDFHLFTTADTREELEEAVNEALAFLWREYAEADARTLSSDAKLLQEDLHKHWKQKTMQEKRFDEYEIE